MHDTSATTVHKHYKGAISDSVLETLLKYHAISSLLVISSGSQQHRPIPSGYIKCATNDLTSLVIKCLAVPLLYMAAYPIAMDIPQSVEPVHVPGVLPLAPSSGDSCLFKKNTLRICLSQQSYTQCPSVLNIPNVTVKKVSQLKIGHGSRDMVAYHHTITVKFPFKDHTIPALVARILDTIFQTSAVIVATRTIGELASIVGALVRSAYREADPIPVGTRIDITPLSCKPSYVKPDELAPLYEYLCLLHRQSRQLSTAAVNDYISTYTVPRCPHSPLVSHPLVQTRIFNTHPHVFNTILKYKWYLISLETQDSNVVLLRDEGNGVLIYEMTRSAF